MLSQLSYTPGRREDSGPPRLSGAPAAAAWLRFFREPLRYLRESERRHGPLHALYRPLRALPAPHLHAFAYGPEWNRQVLSDPVTFKTTGQSLPGPRDSAQRRLRYGLTRSQGERHDRQRALLQPLLQRGPVAAALPAMAEVVDAQLVAWAPGRELDMDREMRRLSLALSARVLFGGGGERALRVGEGIGEWLEQNFRARVWLLLWNAPGTPYRAMLRHAEDLEREILSWVAARQARPGARSDDGGDDALGRLIRAHAEGHPWLSRRDLVGQIAILFGASFETTAHALGWLLLLLAQHPRVVDDLADELAGAGLGPGAGEPSAEALGRLPLLDAVVKESLRILPAVPYTIRSVQRETALGPLPLRRGDRVVISHYRTHHQPDLYPQPRRFRPERWVGLRRNAYQFLPFSAGPRACPGHAFATLSMKLVLVRVLQRFRFSLRPGAVVDPVVRVTLGPRQGLPMRLWDATARPRAEPVRGAIRELVDFDAP